MLPVALDAMGGDRAPGEIIAGARLAFEELGIPVLLVGDPKRLSDIGDLPVLAAGEAIGCELAAIGKKGDLRGSEEFDFAD